MGGELLSLAAARATLEKLDREDVPAGLKRKGERLIDGVNARIAAHGCGGFLAIVGHPSWTFLVITEQPDADGWELKTLFLQEVLARGILTIGTHNLSHAHSDEDVDRLLAAYDEVFPILGEAVAAGDVRARLRCEPLKPLFRVR
jgi:glutamate-1-semialdehyde 2,1-aminomutase